MLGMTRSYFLAYVICLFSINMGRTIRGLNVGSSSKVLRDAYCLISSRIGRPLSIIGDKRSTGSAGTAAL